jgi:hypothetical protein
MPHHSLRRRLIAVAIIFIAGCAIAESDSEQPVPSTGQEKSEKQKQFGKPKKESHRDLRGTKKAPLEVDVIKTKIEEERADDEAKYAKEEAANNWHLFLVTTALAVIAALQWFVMWRQNTHFKRSADISEATLRNLERPYLFVVDITQFKQDKTDEFSPKWIEYGVANYGKSPAIIENIEQEIIKTTAFSNIPEFGDRDRNINFINPILPADITHKKKHAVPAHCVTKFVDRKDHRQEEIAPALEYNEWLFMRIVVKYRGAFTQGHESSLCWRYDIKSNAFIPVGEEAYNYIK